MDACVATTLARCHAFVQRTLRQALLAEYKEKPLPPPPRWRVYPRPVVVDARGALAARDTRHAIRATGRGGANAWQATWVKLQTTFKAS